MSGPIATGRGTAEDSPDRYPPISAIDSYPYWKRPDPYWAAGYWSAPAVFSPRFTEHRDVDELTDATLWVQTTDLLDPASDEGAKAMRTCLRSPSVHRILSILDGLHHANTAQLVAWSASSASNRSLRFVPMFDVGLVERGRYAAGHKHVGKQTYLWKLHDGKPIRRYTGLLPPDTARRIFANLPPRHHAGGPHARHDLLTVEASLRLMEVQPAWIAASPEHATGPVALTNDKDDPGHYTGDIALWRDDGLRVVIEVCASRNLDHHAAKMEKWASWLAGRSIDDTGVVVVFLNAHRDNHRHVAGQLRKMHAEIISPGTLRRHSGQRPLADPEAVQRARSQVMVAAWEDWFPPHHAVSESAVDLVCAYTANGKTWGTVSLADAAAYPFRPTITAPKPHDWLLTPPWAGQAPLTTPNVA
ncbi:hypothetical protein DVS28_b0601 (plasmid) [Euzebya pacifica]|uniref:Uncharacterized protein n=1 Tax=Euzebya pacifica TaxID=1608957 RepID=A0A346Y794_9ACTN|nr:hypothetical protein [Euzebya pacifica]AXV10341.1 hypothetical protein DVS28_b0601 [Euzebya pacifica]